MVCCIFRLLLIMWVLMAGPGSGVQATEMTFRIIDKDTGEPVPSRCLIQDQDQSTYKPDAKNALLTEGSRYFHCEGIFKIDLPSHRKMTLSVDRGLAWVPAEQVFEVTGEGRLATLQLSRYINLFYNRWYSGDMDLQTPSKNLPMMAGAADLNVACRAVPATATQTPELKAEFGVLHSPGMRATSGRDWAFGEANVIAPLYQMDLPETAFEAGVLPAIRRGKDLAGFIDVVDPEGEDVPAAVALGWVDTMRVVGPQKSNAEIWDETRVESRFKAWYRYLNCGFKLPLSAASLAAEKGELPQDRSGFARVYTRLQGSFSFGNFTEGLKKGRSWATNGPLLSLGINKKDPGETIDIAAGESISISVGARSPRPLSRIEVIFNGEVVSSLPISTTADFTVKDFSFPVPESGWFAARAFEKREGSASTVRYAHSSPSYVQVGGVRKVDHGAVEYLLAQAGKRLEALRQHPEAASDRIQQMIGWTESARQIYESLLK